MLPTPDCYIVPSTTVHDHCKDWIGQVPWVRFHLSIEWMAPYKNNWQPVLEALATNAATLIPEIADVEVAPRDGRAEAFQVSSGDLNHHSSSGVSSDTLMEFARRLAEQHRPLVPDHAARFGLNEVAEPQERTGLAPKPAAKSRVCAGCGVALDSKVVFFCQINSKRFEGKLFCRTCQATVTVAQPKCAGCNAEVERKVVEFCQARPERFGNQILCRTCHTPAV